jgi:hypothetical protein
MPIADSLIFLSGKPVRSYQQSASAYSFGVQNQYLYPSFVIFPKRASLDGTSAQAFS